MSGPPIRILSNLARTGGTLVSRCLGAMDSVVLLSEIHPLDRQFYNPLQQACDWYGLLKASEVKPAHEDFNSAIRLIYERCTAAGKVLVIRDWAHLDYVGIPFIREPAGYSLLAKRLANDFEPVSHCITRHPLQQWLSTARLDVMQGRLDFDQFMSGYLRYAKSAVEQGFTRYEEFTTAPETALRHIAHALQLKFDPLALARWPDNRRVTGDMSGTSRGSNLTTIEPLQQRPVDPELLQRCLENTDYRSAATLLGYNDR